MVDLALVTAAMSATASAIGLIDNIADQVEHFLSKRNDPLIPNQYRMRFERKGNSIVSKDQGKELQEITADDFKKLPEAKLRQVCIKCAQQIVHPTVGTRCVFGAGSELS